MIRHIVMFRFLENADGRTRAENARIAGEKLAALQGVVPTLLKSEVLYGADGQADGNYDLVLISEHADLDGLNAYQTHPAHLEVGKFIGKVRESRACIDIEL